MSLSLWKILWTSNSWKLILAVIIDQHLSWKSHISFVFKKISRTGGVITQARFYRSSKTLQALYYSLADLYLTYCNVAWSSTYCSSLSFIYVSQNRILRLKTKAHYLVGNTAPLFSQLKALDINSIQLFNSVSVATFMYSYHHYILPGNLW